MAKILLGVTGSIAAYRACDIARELMRSGTPRTGGDDPRGDAPD
jgi:phosphopantothenoylcysteine synthetase/decarboxylase